MLSAHRKGKTIEWRPLRHTPCIWEVVECPVWNFELNAYRVAVGPREVWVNMVDDEPQGMVYSSKSEAERYAAGGTPTRFLEVLS